MVTGVSGVVGIHVTRVLAEAEERVVGYSTSGKPDSADSILGRFGERVVFVQGDVRDFDRICTVARDFDVKGIIHTAALSGEAQARARPHEMTETNVLGTGNVLEMARRRHLRRVIYIGTAAEYGRRPDLLPITEEEVNVEGFYAETKFLGHRLGLRYHSIFGLDVITVRVSSVYGPNTRFDDHRGLVGNTLIAHLCRAAALGETVRLENGADYPRNWTYAADTASGICLAYWAVAPRYRTYNISSGRLYTVAEVAEAIRDIEPKSDIRIGSGLWEDDPFQAGNLRGPLDISRAREDLGFKPRYDLREGLREYIEWWRGQCA